MSASTSRGFNVARQLRAGHVTVSGVGGPPAPASPGDGQGPVWGADMKGIGQSGAFGGYKQSGLGREWGQPDLEDFTVVKKIIWSRHPDSAASAPIGTTSVDMGAATAEPEGTVRRPLRAGHVGVIIEQGL